MAQDDISRTIRAFFARVLASTAQAPLGTNAQELLVPSTTPSPTAPNAERIAFRTSIGFHPTTLAGLATSPV